MYLDPIVSDDLVLDMIRGELSLCLKLSVYWQDIRLITRCVILLMLMLIIMKMMIMIMNDQTVCHPGDAATLLILRLIPYPR